MVASPSMRNPTVSVLIPAYNVERYLPDCLDSVLTQTYRNLEIIIVNDGSTDGTLAICRQYEKRDSRILIVDQNNRGLAETRNVLVNHATGMYVTFVDSDDRVSPEYVEELIKLVETYDVDIAVCGRDVIDEEGHKHSDSRPGFQNQRLNPEDAVRALNSWRSFEMSAWGKLYLRSLFEGIEYPSGYLSEDGFTTFKLLYEARAVAYRDMPLYHYLQRDGSISKSSKPNLDHVRAADSQADYLLTRWPQCGPIVETACLMARMTVFGWCCARDIPVTGALRKQLCEGNLKRVRFILVNRDLTVTKKIQALLFALSSQTYRIVFNILKNEATNNE